MGQTGSLSVPLVMMISIPLTIIGIMPGFWLLNLLFAEPVAGYPDPIYFTATPSSRSWSFRWSITCSIETDKEVAI